MSSYELEEASREYVNSIPIEEDNPVDKYSLLEEEQHEEPHIELETIVQEAPIEEPAALVESTVNHVHYVEESIIVPPEVTVGEPPKLSYASIVCILFKLLVFYFCMLDHSQHVGSLTFCFELFLLNRHCLLFEHSKCTRRCKHSKAIMVAIDGMINIWRWLISQMKGL